MYVRKIPFIIPLKREATSSSTFTAKTTRWHPNDTIVIDTVAVSVDAHQPKTVHVGVMRDSFPIYLESLILNVNGAFFCTYGQIVVPSGYRVVVKCVSPTTGVLYTINVFGHIELVCKD